MYATLAQFLEAFGQDETVTLSNLHDAAAEQVDETVINRALTDASSEIDSYLGGRYSLPFPSNPPVLIRVCLNIARYRLDSLNPRDDVRLRYEDERRWLENVARGIISLGLPQTDQSVISDQSPVYSAPPRVFSDSNLRGFL